MRRLSARCPCSGGGACRSADGCGAEQRNGCLVSSIARSPLATRRHRRQVVCMQQHLLSSRLCPAGRYVSVPAAYRHRRRRHRVLNSDTAGRLARNAKQQSGSNEQLSPIDPRETKSCCRQSLTICAICHKSVFYRNGWTDRADFWRVGFFRHILYCVIKKFR